MQGTATLSFLTLNLSRSMVDAKLLNLFFFTEKKKFHENPAVGSSSVRCGQTATCNK
jgi:hypothetical protein